MALTSLVEAVQQSKILVDTLSTSNIEPVHIAFGINHAYARGLGITLYSMLKNHPDHAFHVHIFSGSLADDDIRKLTPLVEGHALAITLHIFNIRQSFPYQALLPAFFIALVAFILQAVAETRSALLLFRLFCVGAAVWHIAHGSHKMRALWLGLIVLMLIAGFGAQKYAARVADRIETVKTEIELYQQG
ncbi:glycosyltransferase [Candidatus Pantoea persica]|uniref:glycosyltransferase n=1 Tax=Candidatus Pantoea persica TaxID=2518128 RepID=UPI00215DA04F|nr:glycosyltransferase [Candidatus Pantoea persica]MBA2817711.1 lipopolysaccharide 1,3-galactosyltransferase [Candidatus Pantoea persica]